MADTFDWLADTCAVSVLPVLREGMCMHSLYCHHVLPVLPAHLAPRACSDCYNHAMCCLTLYTACTAYHHVLHLYCLVPCTCTACPPGEFQVSRLMPRAYLDLMRLCLSLDPVERPTLQDVLWVLQVGGGVKVFRVWGQRCKMCCGCCRWGGAGWRGKGCQGRGR